MKIDNFRRSRFQTALLTRNNPSVKEADQSWSRTDEWQQRIAEAMNDLKEGRVKEFDNVEHLIADLHGE